MTQRFAGPALAAVLCAAAVPVTAQDMQHAAHDNRIMHGGMPAWLLMADRLEHARHAGSDLLQWELQGWYGTDGHKLWFKSEGEQALDGGVTGHAEQQLLYSRPLAPYWDLQAGLRHDDGDAGTVSYAAFGLLGLAPYWFETDAALFLSESGKWSARLEVEYELRITQRLILQPRLELNHAFSADAAADRRQGFGDSSLGLRLRYEIRREFAPYVGVEWWRATGAAAAEDDETRVVTGLRWWY